MRLKIHPELQETQKSEPHVAMVNAVEAAEGKALPRDSKKSRKQLIDTRSNIDVRVYQEAVTEQRLALEKEMEVIMQREEDFENPFSFKDLTNSLASR